MGRPSQHRSGLRPAARQVSTAAARRPARAWAALARTATLARADADCLDRIAAEAVAGPLHGDTLAVAELASLPEAIRTRVLLSWLRARGATDVSMVHVGAVDRLVTAWRGQTGVDVPRGRVTREAGRIGFTAAPPGPLG